MTTLALLLQTQNVPGFTQTQGGSGSLSAQRAGALQNGGLPASEAGATANISSDQLSFLNFLIGQLGPVTPAATGGEEDAGSVLSVQSLEAEVGLFSALNGPNVTEHLLSFLQNVFPDITAEDLAEPGAALSLLREAFPALAGETISDDAGFVQSGLPEIVFTNGQNLPAQNSVNENFVNPVFLSLASDEGSQDLSLSEALETLRNTGFIVFRPGEENEGGETSSLSSVLTALVQDSQKPTVISAGVEEQGETEQPEGQAFGLLQILAPQTEDRPQDAAVLAHLFSGFQSTYGEGEQNGEEGQVSGLILSSLNRLLQGVEGDQKSGVAETVTEGDAELDPVLGLLQNAVSRDAALPKDPILQASQRPNAVSGVEHAPSSQTPQTADGTPRVAGPHVAPASSFSAAVESALTTSSPAFEPGNVLPVAGQGLSGSSPAAITDLSVAAPQVTQSHPAVQTLAATVHKAAADGEVKTMMLHLDPPDLGRVNVKVEFGEDAVVRAWLVIEKPETHAMLQRDSHILTKTLQDAGVDIDNGGLNFELAQDNNSPFDQNDDRRGGNGEYGSGQDFEDSELLEIVETTVNWDIDPETGFTRYNLIV